MEDLEGRAGKALSARTVGELDALQSDLPCEPQHARAQTRRVLILLAEGVACVVIGVLIVMIAILLALAWIAARLAAAVAARSLPSRRVPTLSADH